MQVQKLEWLRHFPWPPSDMISEHRGRNDPWAPLDSLPPQSLQKRMWTHMDRWFNRLVKMSPSSVSCTPVSPFFSAPERVLLGGGPWVLLSMVPPKPNKNNNKRIWAFCFHFIYFLLLSCCTWVTPGSTLRIFSWQSLGDHKGYGGRGIDWTWVNWMQGKAGTVAPAPRI